MGFGISNQAAGQLSIRGIGGAPTTGVLILVDGVPQIMGLFGHPMADAYLTANVEQIDVIRGPASMLYGNNAMGGAVNIRTKTNNDNGFSNNIALKYGSFNSMNVNGQSSFKNRHFDLMASLSSNTTNGERMHSAFKSSNTYLKAAYRFNAHVSIATDYNATRFRVEDPGPDTLAANIGSNYRVDRSNWSVVLRHQNKAASGFLRIFENAGIHHISDGFYSEDNNAGISLNESIHPFKTTFVNVGMDLNSYRGYAKNTSMPGLLIDTTLVKMDVYALAQQTFLNQVTLQAGLRIHFNTYKDVETIPSGGISWVINPKTTWKAAVNKGFRDPTLRELFIWNHNRDLQPERIWNYETSLIQKVDYWNSQLEATLFTLSGNNLIVAGSMGKLYNTGKVNNKGLEMALTTHPSKNSDVQLTFSHVQMEIPIYGTPRNQLFLNGSYRMDKWQFQSGLRWIEHLQTVISNAHSDDIQSFTLVNAQITFHASKNLTLGVLGENIFNQNYETIRYFTMPGSSISSSIRYKF